MTSQRLPSDCTTSIGCHEPYRPFNQVPPELLDYILYLTWLSYRGDNSTDRFRFPSIPCLVNRYFNRVAISTPTLWSYLRVTSVADLAHNQERVQRRSGALPLDLYVGFERMDYEDLKALMKKIIVQSSSRLRTIALSYPGLPVPQVPADESFWDHLSPLSEHPLHISRFSIDGGDAPPLRSLPPFTSSIRHLNIVCNQFSWSEGSLPYTLEVLSILERRGNEVGTATIIRFLSGSLFHSLRSLSLCHILIEDPEGVLAESCILESLEYFKLDEFYLWEFLMVISSMHTPNLQHLFMNISYHKSIPDVLVTAWDGLRLPDIRRITLQGFQYHDVELLELIQKLPRTVDFLEVTGAQPLKAFRDPSATSFCSRLHQIVTHGAPLDALASLVEGRCPSLQELELRYGAFHQRKHLTKEKFMRCFSILKNSATKLTVFEDGENPNADEPICLTSEQLATFFIE